MESVESGVFGGIAEGVIDTGFFPLSMVDKINPRQLINGCPAQIAAKTPGVRTIMSWLLLR
jgi:hypothetical protein